MSQQEAQRVNYRVVNDQNPNGVTVEYLDLKTGEPLGTEVLSSFLLRLHDLEHMLLSNSSGIEIFVSEDVDGRRRMVRIERE